MRNLLAFDLGASNGRAILGQFDGEKLTMRELHRFENNYIEMNGVFYWDLPYLYNQLKQGLLAFKNANVGELDCICIDTWGVDYGLLDKNGQLLSNPRSYRYALDADMEAVWKTVDFPTLFARTGIATMNFNTVYQLYRRKLQDDFNRAHGIVPRTIRKSVREMVEISHSAEEASQLSRKKLTDRERAETIARLEKEMKEASRMLEFEYAALLRDQIIELRGQK